MIYWLARLTIIQEFPSSIPGYALEIGRSGGSSSKALGYRLDGPGGVEIFFIPSCPDWP